MPLNDTPQNAAGGNQQSDPVAKFPENDEVIIIEENISHKDSWAAAFEVSDACSCTSLFALSSGFSTDMARSSSTSRVA